MTIRAVLFDLGNTLLEYCLHGRWREFLRQRLEEMQPLVCEQAGPVPLSPGESAQRMAQVIGGRGPRAIERGGQSWHFRERLREGLAAVGLSADGECLERLTDAFYEPIRACTRPYPETRAALERLRALRVKQAVITNSPWDTPARLLRGDLEQWGMADYFDAFICSGELPWRKPNPRFMHAAADALGVAPGDCLVVGDTIEIDIAGAQGAGMRSVWVSREGAPAPPGGPQPGWVVGELTGVVDIVGRESKAT